MLLDYSKTEQCYQLTQLLSRLHLNLVGVRNMYIGVKNLLSLMIKLNVPKTSLKFSNRLWIYYLFIDTEIVMKRISVLLVEFNLNRYNAVLVKLSVLNL